MAGGTGAAPSAGPRVRPKTIDGHVEVGRASSRTLSAFDSMRAKQARRPVGSRATPGRQGTVAVVRRGAERWPGCVRSRGASRSGRARDVGRGRGSDSKEWSRFKQIGEFLLAFCGEEEVVEGAEAPALVGLGDPLSVRHHIVEQAALGALPAGYLFTELAVEARKFSSTWRKSLRKIAGRAGELLVPVRAGLLDQRHRCDPPRGQRSPCRSVLDDAPGPRAARPDRCRPVDHLPEQLEDRVQARCVPMNGALAEVLRPMRSPSRPPAPGR